MPVPIRLYLDDRRIEPEGWFRVTTAENCIQLLQDFAGQIEELSLDFDLGERTNGEAVAKWLEEKAFTGAWQFVPWILDCHSDDPDGRKRIMQAFANIRKWHEQEKF